MNIRQCPSPHFNERPKGQKIDLLVIHNISLPPGEFGGGFIEDFFKGELDESYHPYFETIKELRVSSHFLIQRDGVISQFVDTQNRAWHAGVSCWQGRDNCNDFSIGIELEGTDDIPYTEQQYESLAILSASLIEQYPDISMESIVGHCDIAPSRKTDPGDAFDWKKYRQLLSKRLSE